MDEDENAVKIGALHVCDDRRVAAVPTEDANKRIDELEARVKKLEENVKKIANAYNTLLTALSNQQSHPHRDL
jgi:prefoldin subunit 5